MAEIDSGILLGQELAGQDGMHQVELPDLEQQQQWQAKRKGKDADQPVTVEEKEEASMLDIYLASAGVSTNHHFLPDGNDDGSLNGR